MNDQSLTADDFPTFFRDVHDCDPFPWQHRLASEVLSTGRWPATIGLPTGTGKTAVLDVAVFALAACPARFPRRIVFVIDRRIVVDQVCLRAKRIAERVQKARTALLSRVCDHLLALSDGGQALGVAALRGGIPIDNEWARQPDQPWVVVSTVDQFGSRLLFRGYGVNRRMRPIHAGLAGNDCLVVLDEVHLSAPFAETLGQIGAFEPGKLPRRFVVVEMSATPRAKERPFRLEPASDIKECEEMRRRVCAKKEAKLESVQNHKLMPAKILRLVKSMTSPKIENRPSSIGVVVNRVRVARETHEVLQEAGYDVHLLTGRMRALDRVKTLEAVKPLVDPDRETSQDEVAIVVATQAIEVGADFSFDALVTECAAIDSLRQRFGRLDRRGKHYEQTGKPAQAIIVGPRAVVASKKPDPVYGEAVRRTWEELRRRSEDDGTGEQQKRELSIDVGPQALSDFPEEAKAPRDKAPIVMRTHMDAWVQTSPEPIVQPMVEQFLHGMEKTASADVSIVWRRDCSADVLELAPPRPAEFLQVPVGAAKAWLADRDEVEIADHGAAADDDGDAAGSDSSRVAYRWVAAGKKPETVKAGEVRPGDVIVVPADRGGLRAGTWDPMSREPVEDLGDQAQLGGYEKLALGCRAVLRLDSCAVAPDAMNAADAAGFGPPPKPSDEATAVDPRRARVKKWLAGLADANGQPRWRVEAARRLLEHGFEITPVGVSDNSEAGYFVLTQRHGKMRRVDDRTMDSYDESGSHQGTGSTLEAHLEGVARRAARFAQRLGLSQELANDLRLAGRLHDLGKLDQRFQEELVGGDPVSLEQLDEPLAKSLPGTKRVSRRPHGMRRGGGLGQHRPDPAKWLSRYPEGMRHEFASLAMAESNRDALRTAHDVDLVLHLIGSHHGCGRPLPPIVKDFEPQELEYAFRGHVLTANTDLADTPLALGVADRFWRLVERYGYYGLAWLESVMRLADHRESAEPSCDGENPAAS